MPMKHRRSKRRQEIPAEAWDMVFASGHDFMGELADYRIADDEQSREEARKVWPELGSDFMERRKSDPHAPYPWAAERFGEPPCQ